jgi:beta-galactosidase
LLFKACKQGKEVASYSLITAGAAADINAKADRMGFSALKKETSHIEIQLKDKNGNLVYDSEDEISVKIEGPARLLGFESGSLDGHESYQSAIRKVHHGKLHAYLQSDGKPGTIK